MTEYADVPTADYRTHCNSYCKSLTTSTHCTSMFTDDCELSTEG